MRDLANDLKGWIRVRCAVKAIRLIGVLLAFCAGNVSAQLINPGETTSFFNGTIPENPVVGQPYLVSVRQGPCEGLTDNVVPASIVTTAGPTITVQVLGLPVPQCNVPVTERVYVMPPLTQPGVYTIDFLYNDEGMLARIGTRLITVVAQGTGQGSAPVTIPTLGLLGLMSTIVGLVALGARKL